VAEALSSSKKSLTRGKAILIGVLAVVLVVVLYVQFGDRSEKPADGQVKYRPPHPAVAVQSANATAQPITLAATKTPSNEQANQVKSVVAAALIDEARWISPKLETVTAYDPFALPATFPQPPKVAAGTKGNGADGLIAAATADDAKKLAEAVEELRMQLEELTQRGVHVIVREGDQYVAVIDERVLHVGDKINDFTVTAIDPDGVHIERKDSP
jgi:hypothetical protein